MRSILAAVVFLVMTGHGTPPDLRRVAGEPTAPARLEFEKRLLDGSEFGYLYPAFVDFDGDGKVDLAVGTDGYHHPGRLLVYLNRGTNAAPVYAKPSWFDDVLPSGRIPGG
jgi:FG-GAP repeat